MPANRYFLNAPFTAHSEVRLEGKEAHHLIHVMRKKEGERLELINGKGALGKGVIKEAGKRHVDITLEEVLTTSDKRHLILCQALTKMSKLELIVEKSVELGVSAISLFPAEKSDKKTLSDTQKQRLEAIAISAMKQCGRLDLPPISYFHSLLEIPLLAPLYFGTLDPKAPLFTNVFSGEGVFMVGPESGWSEKELQLLPERGAGVRLNDNTLRAETAAITFLACAGALTPPL